MDEKIDKILKEIEEQSFILEDGFYKDCKVYHASIKNYLEEELPKLINK